MPGLVVGGLVGDGRARADHAHVALEDVEQLRQLVDAGHPDDPADRRDARIGLHLVAGGALVVGGRFALARADQPGHVLAVDAVIAVDLHRAELVEGERHAAPAQTLLLEDDRPGRGETHHQGDDQHQRPEHGQGDQRRDDVERALEPVVAEVVDRLGRRTQHLERVARRRAARQALEDVIGERGRRGQDGHVGDERGHLGDQAARAGGVRVGAQDGQRVGADVAQHVGLAHRALQDPQQALEVQRVGAVVDRIAHDGQRRTRAFRAPDLALDRLGEIARAQEAVVLVRDVRRGRRTRSAATQLGPAAACRMPCVGTILMRLVDSDEAAGRAGLGDKHGRGSAFVTHSV